jgi:hypothetical protein
VFEARGKAVEENVGVLMDFCFRIERNFEKIEVLMKF